MSKITITPEFKKALKLMEETDNHIFLTGRAGTGKSTLLNHFRKTTKKNIAVLAPTGVAALNVKGQTIHSFFGFHPEININLVRKAFKDKLELFKQIETIVIDEISMVRADLLDCIDRALRINRGKMREPFGGVQMIFIGDLFQLPPVVTRDQTERFQTEYPSPFFFSAGVMGRVDLSYIELTKIHRQSEKGFIEMLEKIRTRNIDEDDLDTWNNHHDPFFDAEDAEGYIHLTTTNKAADQRNRYELQKLDSKEWKLKASKDGKLPDRRMPSEAALTVKKGARIMFTVNDPDKRFVNGTLGTIDKIEKSALSKTPVLHIVLEDGTLVELKQHTWEIFEYQSADGSLEESVIGRYTQYPIALAWAVTIHKAQGKTFDNVLVDLGWGAFAHGQLYVALSRATKKEGIVLMKPLQKKDCILDPKVMEFTQSLSKQEHGQTQEHSS
jgi:ATP-dependent exoDNAse (exonuclease V) alpha subunit